MFPLLFSFALKLGQADPSRGDSFQTELPERLLCHERSQYRCHAQKLIEKRLTCFKACWELGARRKPKVLKLRFSPVCYKKATYGHKSDTSGPVAECERWFWRFLVLKVLLAFRWISSKTKPPYFEMNILSSFFLRNETFTFNEWSNFLSQHFAFQLPHSLTSNKVTTVKTFVITSPFCQIKQILKDSAKLVKEVTLLPKLINRSVILWSSFSSHIFKESPESINSGSVKRGF